MTRYEFEEALGLRESGIAPTSRWCPACRLWLQYPHGVIPDTHMGVDCGAYLIKIESV